MSLQIVPENAKEGAKCGGGGGPDCPRIPQKSEQTEPMEPNPPPPGQPPPPQASRKESLNEPNLGSELNLSNLTPSPKKNGADRTYEA